MMFASLVVWLGSAFAQSNSVPTVTVPLSTWEARQKALEAVPLANPAALTLGAATWEGTADPETLALSLRATLQVRKVGDGPIDVPLVDARAPLLSVTVNGRAVAVDVRDGLHVWPAVAPGEHTVVLQTLVAPRGQRGALEYDFRVPKTAATRLELVLPRPDLKPEVHAAVRTTVRTEGSVTRVVSELAPTDRIALLGLRDLSAAEGRPAKRFAETQHLVSVDEHRLEVFSVFRYTILYAGSRQFDIFVPEGLTVEAADGQGAYGTTIVATDGGTLIRGETALPMRESYEVSVRLSRAMTAATETRLELPRALGVEREHAWVGVEAPGRIVLDEVTPDGTDAVDVSMLPVELARSSVSPLLAGFRSNGSGAIRLRANPLPEVEVSPSRIDRIDASTVVSASGRTVTELTVLLRNRFRPGLLLTLPEGTEVTRALLDGEAVVPTRGQSENTVLVPLIRSERPFVVQVVLTTDVGAPGWFGNTSFALPAFELPASAVSWRLHLPDGVRWGPVDADLPSQTLTGSGHWLADKSASQAPAVAAVPQVKAPDEGGTMRSYERYWVPAGAKTAVWVRHTSGSLRTTAVAAGGGLLLLLLLGVVAYRRRQSATR